MLGDELRAVVDIIDDGFQLIEPLIGESGEVVDFRYVMVNPAFEQQSGLSAPDILGKRVREVLPNVESVWFEKYTDIVKYNKTERFVEFNQDTNRWYDMHCFRYGDKHIGVLFRDITDRLRAEAELARANETLEKKVDERTRELAESEDRFRSTNDALRAERQRLYDVLDNLSVMVCLLTRDHRIAFANRAFTEMFGEHGGRPCYDVCFHQDEPCSFCESFKVFETGHSHQWRVETMTGRTIIANDFPFTDIDGTSMILEMDVDVTEQRRMEEDLKRSNAELRQFAYVASHDLREPLRMVTSYLDLLDKKYKGKVLDAKAEEYIRFAVDGASRMQQMINDLLAYSRIETQGRKFRLVDMNDVMAATLMDLKEAIDESGATVTFEQLPPVIGDKTQLTMLMENLVGNAIKFHGTIKPVVRVKAAPMTNDWVFSVEDNGIGIDIRHQGKLFNMFQRLHTVDEYPGTGIGLAIAKKIVERHGGSIWMESEPGMGSTFFFTIPNRATAAEG